MKKMKKGRWKSYLEKKSRLTVVTYTVVRLLVVLVLVRSIFTGQLESVFTCLLTLFLLFLPAIVSRKLHMQLPTGLEITVILFIFAAEILNRDRRTKFELSPIFLALVAFCFSMTIGALWEIFEFSVDRLFMKDMQKDTIVHAITSVTLDPTNSNIPITISGINDVVVNGESLGLGGYLDIGLIDTMGDLIVNLIGALVFSVIGFFHQKSKHRSKVAEMFVPTVQEEENSDERERKSEN